VAFGGVLRLLETEKSLYAVEAFLPGEIPDDSVAVVKRELERSKHVGSVEYVSADSALADFRRHFNGEMLNLVEGNPIPPFFRIRLDDESLNPVDLIDVRNAIGRTGNFEEVQAPVEWVEKISAWKFRMVFWPVCLSILLLVTLSLIICNSVRLSLLSRKLLVENMKYAGGSYAFIEFPFVLEGFMQGLLGSGGAALLLVVLMNSVEEALPMVGAYMAGAGSLLVLVVMMVSVLSAMVTPSISRRFCKTLLSSVVMLNVATCPSFHFPFRMSIFVDVASICF
jgi:cell division transport system permease protein